VQAKVDAFEKSYATLNSQLTPSLSLTNTLKPRKETT
jgi:hypothetical protein